MEKVVPITKKVEADIAREQAEDAERTEEMAKMLESVTKSVRAGEITAFVFVGRKERGDGKKDVFEYIMANTLDVGLIGEIHILLQRLARMYDRYTDGNAQDE